MCRDQAVQLLTSDSSLTYLSCYFQVRENIAMNSQISIREVAAFPVMKMERHVCLFCFALCFCISFSLVVHNEENCLQISHSCWREYCGKTAVLWLHHSCLLCVWERNVWRMRVLFSPCLPVRPSVRLSHEKTREPLNTFSWKFVFDSFNKSVRDRSFGRGSVKQGIRCLNSNEHFKLTATHDSARFWLECVWDWEMFGEKL